MPAPPKMSKEDERAFRRCLSLVKTKAKLTGTTLEIRPENVNEFKIKLGRQSEAIDKAIEYLQTHPAEYVKFIH